MLLKSITLTFEPRMVYGLIGKNGVGKTTFLKQIAHLAHPTSGSVSKLNPLIVGCSFGHSTSYVLRDTLKQKQMPCVANHFSPFTLLISKIVVASIYTSCLYSVVVVISILLNCLIIGFPLSQIQIGLMFSFIGLNALAMIAFMSLCCTVCLLFKSSQYAHLTSLFVFLAGGFYKLMSIALNENTRTEIIISGINPFVHTMYFSALNTQRIMPFIIFLILSLILSFVFSKVILDNRDYY